MEGGPVKLPVSVWYRGRSVSQWRYDSLPGGMRRARTTDLYQGRQVLYEVLAGPDAGRWYTDIVRPSVYHTLVDRINAGFPVYVSSK